MTTWLRRAADVASSVAFRSVEIRRRAAEPSGPVLVLANHGGGLADILAVIDACNRFPRFLARDVIWRFPIARQVMTYAGAIPVHRREDHQGNANNTGMFDDARAALVAGDLLAIYPEGESIDAPRLAPLRTGAARIALNAWANGVDVRVQPMGLHYFDVSVLRGRCFVDVGEPVAMSRVLADLGIGNDVSDADRDVVHQVTAAFAERLGVVADEYDGWEQRRTYLAAAAVYLNRMATRRGDASDYEQLASVANAIARAPADQRDRVDVSMTALEANLELLGMDIDQLPRVQLAGAKLAAQTSLVLALLPAAAYGMVVNGLPMLAIRAVSLTGMAPATAASVKPAVAAITFPAMWTIIGRAAVKELGVARGSLVAAAGPLSLYAAVAVSERLQLMRSIARLVRRGRGPVWQQVAATANDVEAAVALAISPAAS